MPFKKLVTGLFSCLALSPTVLTAQSAQPCVDFAWEAFRNEIENEINAVTARGDDYLTAYGHIRSTQTCLQFTEYPSELSEKADAFRAAVDQTEGTVANAIRTNTNAPIFALARIDGGSDGDGVEYLYPDNAPGGDGPGNRPRRPGSNLNSSATLDGLNMTMEVAPQDERQSSIRYRMLSREEIRRVQVFLTRIGYDTGGIDGIAGERTYNAIRRFQRAEGLGTTGVLTSAQLERILN